MSRIFLGGGGKFTGGTKRPQNTKIDKKTGKPVQLTGDEQYKKIFEDKIASFQKDYSAGKKNAFHLPGTKSNDETPKTLSKSALAVLEKIAAIKTKRETGKKDTIKIAPKFFGGMHPGRLDSNGNIYNAQNQVIAKVNPKNGRISNPMGFSLGKYKPDDNFSDFRISKIIANAAIATINRQNAQNTSGWNPMTGGMGAPADSGGSGGGSIYGDSGGFWGTSKDDDNKGWW